VGGDLRRAAQAVELGRRVHDASFAPNGNTFADTYSTRTTAPVVRLCHVQGDPASARNCRVFWETHALDAYHVQAPEQFEVKAHDGTTLYATLLMPPGQTNSATVPLIVNPYGGPGDQEVLNEWKDNLLFDNVLARMDLRCSAPIIAAWAAADAPLRKRPGTTSVRCSLKIS